MKYKHSAFIENTPEMREWLDKLGYDKLGVIRGKKYLVTDLGYYSGTMAMCGYPIINCLNNPELFKAVTAIREDSDAYQWFVFNQDIFDTDWNRKIIKKYSKGDFFQFHNNKLMSSMVHKATLEELKVHFKIEEK